MTVQQLINFLKENKVPVQTNIEAIDKYGTTYELSLELAGIFPYRDPRTDVLTIELKEKYDSNPA